MRPTLVGLRRLSAPSFVFSAGHYDLFQEVTPGLHPQCPVPRPHPLPHVDSWFSDLSRMDHSATRSSTVEERSLYGIQLDYYCFFPGRPSLLSCV